MMRKKVHGLSIFLLKPDVISPELALKEAVDFSKEMLIGEINCVLYYKNNKSYTPKWVSLFRPKLGNDLDFLSNSGTAATLLIPLDQRYFAVTFGYGKSILRSDCFEENFGLKIVLNSVDPQKLRSIDAKSLEAVPVSRRSQASIATNFSDFGLDIEQDLICAATGKPKNLEFGAQLTGKDALKISVPMSLEDIPSLLIKLYEQYNSIEYKENFAWIDHLSEVRNKALIGNLDDALVNKISSKDFSRTWLSIPDIIEWSDFGGFKYRQPKRGVFHSDICWKSYLESLNVQTQEYSVGLFQKHSVYCISESSGQPFHDWSVYRCIYCELEYEGASYSLQDGKWYRIDKDFLDTLNKVVENIPKADIQLPENKCKNEALYNEAVYQSNSTYFALMDQKNISYGGGRSKIEFCDLYTSDKHLIHVKRYGGSSVLSHLFSQGLISAELLLSDQVFREKVNEKLPTSHQLLNTSQKPVANEFEVIYAIASNRPLLHLELPLFSKINLRNCYNRLRMWGINVSLAYVPVVTDEGGEL